MKREHKTQGTTETRQLCTGVERAEFERHMLANRDTGELLLHWYRQWRTLTKSFLVGAERIGDLTSFFRTVDDVSSFVATGRVRFSLREALRILQEQHRQHGDVKRRHDKIRSYQALFESPTSNPIVTIVEFVDDSVLVDGNHSAMAAYLHAVAHPEPPYCLPVFVLHVPRSVVELP
jgi:hypothetical protein